MDNLKFGPSMVLTTGIGSDGSTPLTINRAKYTNAYRYEISFELTCPVWRVKI